MYEWRISPSIAMKMNIQIEKAIEIVRLSALHVHRDLDLEASGSVDAASEAVWYWAACGLSQSRDTILMGLDL